MALFLAAFLGAFALVVLLGATFVALYRHQARRRGGQLRGLERAGLLTVRRGSTPCIPPPRWLAVRSSNTHLLKELLGMGSGFPQPWSEALMRCRDKMLFVSPPVEGWTLIVGGAIPDPSDDVDACYHFLTRLSREIGEIQFFAADRVLNHHAWVRVRDGHVVRGYAWSGETLWNEGRITLDERFLGLQIHDYAEDIQPVRYDEAPAEQTNAERVVLLARRWGIDPIEASEIILQVEHLASDPESPGRD